MYLYHYNKKHFNKILTRRRQGIVTPQDLEAEAERAKFRADIGLYCDSISFFFDPIPADIIGDLFHNEHPFWHNGNKLWQYQIDTKYLERHIKFEVLESPEQIEMLDRTGWKDDDDWKFKWFRDRKKMLAKLGQIGFTREDLERQCQIFSGTTRQHYQSAVVRPDFEEVKTLYAACVPHVSIYPTSGIVNPHQVKQITIGDHIAFEEMLFNKWT